MHKKYNISFKTIFFLCTLVFIGNITLPTKVVVSAELKNSKSNLKLSADQLTHDQETGIVIASGNVVIRHNGYILLADLVRYNQNTNKVIAEQNVQITGLDGTVLHIDKVELNDDLKEGFIKNVRLILEDGSRLAAKNGERIEGNKTVLNYAVYSPCAFCEKKEKKS